MEKKKTNLISKEMFLHAVRNSFLKLTPQAQAGKPVILLIYILSITVTALYFISLTGILGASSGFLLAAAILLWITVLSANYTEAIAREPGKIQADSLRASRRDTTAKLLKSPFQTNSYELISSSLLKRGDIFVVEAGEKISADGEVIDGAASVDESAITGESAPVIREAGGDRSTVTGGTTVLSDRLVIRVTQELGESFLDKMITMVGGVAGKKTRRENTLEIFLIILSLLFTVITLLLYAFPSTGQTGITGFSFFLTLGALFICLLPVAFGALLPIIGIAGMSRLNQANVLAMNTAAIEAAGNTDILMLDKTGSITLGNRQAAAFIPVDGCSLQELADAAQLASLADETPEGRSIVILAKEQFGLRGRQISDKNMAFIPYSAASLMSGVDYDNGEIRKGAAGAVSAYVQLAGGFYSRECRSAVEKIETLGGTPLLVAKNHKILGIIQLKDIIKDGIRDKFADMRKMGIKTIMITEDSAITATAIAAEAGVDDYLAQASPETVLELIRKYQAKGHLVAVTGDSIKDTPALAQADVAVAMNSGTQSVKETGNMVDLDSSPIKLIEIVKLGRQLLLTRRSIVSFSIASDLAKYLVILPVILMGLYPGLSPLNIMGLYSAESAILSGILYSALVILASNPLVLRGVRHYGLPLKGLKSRNLFLYGMGGLILPFGVIKLIDSIITAVGIVS